MADEEREPGAMKPDSTLASGLRRVTSDGKFVPEIDGLRFVAISSVVIYHLHWALENRLHLLAPPGWATQFLEHGARGVQIFFTISGFILGLPFAAHYLSGRDKVSLRHYFLRRITRLEPPYILCLVILFFVEALGHRYSLELLKALAASLVYLHNLIFGEGSRVNGVAWSLEVEIQFYLLVPLLTLLFSIRRHAVRRTILSSLIIGICVLQFFSPQNPRLVLSIAGQIQFFLAGFLLADIYLVDWREKPKGSWHWDIVSLAVWPALFYWSDPRFQILMPFLNIFAFCAAFKGVLSRKIFSHSSLTTIGGMCYTIYLYHWSVLPRALALTRHLGTHANYYVVLVYQFFLTVPFLAVVSIFFFLIVERPCMQRDWPQRAWRVLFERKMVKATSESPS